MPRPCAPYMSANGKFNSAKALVNGYNTTDRTRCDLEASKMRGSLRSGSMPSRYGGRRTRKNRKNRKTRKGRKSGKSRRNNY